MPKQSKQQPNDGFEEISIDFHRFEKENDMLEGEVVGKDTITIRDADVGKYTIQSPDGKRTAFLGGVQLDPLMEDVEVGDTIRLIFMGKQKTSGNTEVKTFKLMRKRQTA